MAEFQAVVLGMVTTSFIFFYLYDLFRQREEEGIDSMLNQGLAMLFFGFGFLFLDGLLFSLYRYVTEGTLSYLSGVAKVLFLTTMLVTTAIFVIQILKAFLIFLKQFFLWVGEKLGF